MSRTDNAAEEMRPAYPDIDGTVAPYPVINMGHGLVVTASILHDRRLPALWLGRDGKGMGHFEVYNREAKPGETLAVVTFANVEGLDVLLHKLIEVKAEHFMASTVVAETLDEVGRATSKFPTWPTDPLHALAVLGEEFGELTKAMLQLTYEPHKTSMNEVRNEAIQTAAMALRLAMSLDRYEYTRSDQHEQGGTGS